MYAIDWADEHARGALLALVPIPKPGEPRRCFDVSDAACTARGYIPSLVTESAAGHAPMVGHNPPTSTWYWGPTRREAERICELANREHFGVEPADRAAIVDSSIAAQLREDAAREAAAARYDRARGV